MASMKNPNTPKLIDVTWNPRGSESLLSSGSPKLLSIDSAMAPRTTPQMLPMPPMMTIVRMNTDLPNANWSTLTEVLMAPK